MGCLMYYIAFILWFDHFLDSWAEICQIFRWFFGNSMTPKRHTEINLPLVIENLRFIFRDNTWWGAQKIWMCYYVSKLLSFAYDMIKTLQTRINQLYIFGSCLQFVDMYQIGTYFLFIRLQQPILNKNNCSFLKWFDLKIRPGGLFFSQIVY